MEGTSFGRYRLVELLGRGGMGEVWRAYDTVTDRVVAVKILPAEISDDEVFQQRFRREAHAAARLSNPHLIPIHTYGEINGRLFVDMRLIEGRDLQSVLSHGPLPPMRAVRIIEQVAKALHAAHRDGLLHRDVKPSNILLDADDFAYLIDFGIARAAGELGLTTVGDVIGTCHYMAPERLSTAQIDARSDIYSLACVLYECLTAQRPFPGDIEEQITSHLEAPPPRPSSTIPGLPVKLDMVIAKGMAKNPDDRYETAVELARAAHDALTAPPLQPSVRTPPPTPHPVGAHAHPDTRGQPRSPRQNLPAPPTMPRQLAEALSVPGQQLAAGPPAEVTRSPSRPWWRRKAVAISAAALLTVAVAVAAMVTVSKLSPERTEFQQVVLPFTGLRDPHGLSVDSGGTVYVGDTLHNRILALFAGSTTPVVLPFDGLSYPTGVTADNSGTVYVNDAGNRRVVVLPAGSKTQVTLPFTDLSNPTGLSVDSSRTVYVTDTAKNRVVALYAGSNAQFVLPFTGLSDPTGLVVDGSGTVIVADGGNNRVLALPAGAKTQVTLPFTGLKQPGGVTVDSEGAVYVTNKGNGRILKLPPGSSTQVELHFTGLDNPWGLAVDNMGTVYVGGRNDQIVALRQK
ncbi:serine/threonine-protein kinase pknD [Mycobacterium kansasii 732]|uniref:non-specific serine/threonine protein kinase n=1 Tax=Mycobacterium pseudokansasii TaxID=2341080 RepID=A0A498QQY9_9MYCO|nr:serine/threonine-protein kinase PknD [Mycobacterium pseudokansasii]EUA10726.1 serine/threonine-protein kinase pknD [Mycobacterium kansasii 732]KZS70025.1 serine/threonine protein kinase [Mycobacterium kansasii]VAZ97328.1 Serine/threonine-protein kinase PknD [Mycobacterium pseudokansasii]VAZ98784.1 Serine/threonine-protein kinase PknD [Mycobacterium pseudokansasii]VBA52358.1 Serine/threonine-protein kinase PknD [Mycobacterium pseudokansasii]